MAVTKTPVDYCATLAHATKRQQSWFLREEEEIASTSAACRQLLGSRDQGYDVSASRILGGAPGGGANVAGRLDFSPSSKKKKKKKKTSQCCAVAAGREVGIFDSWRACNERVNGVSG